ncbi:MAG: 30S ribosomal protein S17 [Deltaproteobacteria bacterium]|nr:MAG: 30S ribosomal protein S17 [Deltaproteobacteria bacterium]
MAATDTKQTESKRGIRRTIQGVVTSAGKMDKTVVVTVVRRIRDRRFHKFVKQRVKYKAHDERNEYRLGDVVELVESRPYSKTKRWRVARAIERAREDAQ